MTSKNSGQQRDGSTFQTISGSPLYWLSRHSTYSHDFTFCTHTQNYMQCLLDPLMKEGVLTSHLYRWEIKNNTFVMSYSSELHITLHTVFPKFQTTIALVRVYTSLLFRRSLFQNCCLSFTLWYWNCCYTRQNILSCNFSSFYLEFYNVIKKCRTVFKYHNKLRF